MKLKRMGQVALWVFDEERFASSTATSSVFESPSRTPSTAARS